MQSRILRHIYKRFFEPFRAPLAHKFAKCANNKFNMGIKHRFDVDITSGEKLQKSYCKKFREPTTFAHS
jgi:hypothetical protein